MALFNHKYWSRVMVLWLATWTGSALVAQTTKLNVDFRTPGTVYYPVSSPANCAQWIYPETESDEHQLYLQAPPLTETCQATWEIMVSLGQEDKITVLEFNHLFDFPENQGGWVEVSYDGGISWTNLADDKFGEAVTRFYGDQRTYYVLPPCFAGTSGRFWSTKYQWVWQDKRPESLHIRFVFGAQVPKGQSPTWVIDNVWIFGVAY